MSSYSIDGLFPTPLLRTSLDRRLSGEEEVTFKFDENLSSENFGNRFSQNTYILESSSLIGIKDFIDKSIAVYLRRILDPENDTKLYITQSWLNFTEPGEFHHRHHHPNSFVSGIFYPKADRKIDSVTFHSSDLKQIQVTSKKWNWYNSSNVSYPVGTGDLFLFPSTLAHSVETHVGSDLRVSLAFNTFISGTIGNINCMNQLKI